VIGVVSCVAGLYLSYTYNLAAGGLIVLVVTSFFLVCWIFAPRHGILARRMPNRPRHNEVDAAVSSRLSL
jgi:manganese/iron transport system permease protein